MKRRLFALRYRQDGDIVYPEFPKLHLLVSQWAETHFSTTPIFSNYIAVWADCSIDDDGEPVECHGVIGGHMSFDTSMFRFTDQHSAAALMNRMEEWLHDNGYRGREVMVRVGLSDDQVCPDAAKWLKAKNCKPAERFLYTVR